jgi:glycosyltransferase involved in cell wall biosynthesis
MNKCPVVSVVIPTRGRPSLLRRAILSALQQSCQSLEVIVVLDGDDEGTRDAVALIADCRIRLVVLKDAVGGAEARNVGGRHATGRYIALLDDDDEWLPRKLEKQLALANPHSPNPFVVVNQYLHRVAGQEDEVWPGHLPRKNEPLSEFLCSSRGGFQTSTYLCPRELFLRVPFTKGLKKHQDWDWFLQLASLPGFDLLIVPEPLSIYWVPLRVRTSISGSLDWALSFAWAKSRLPLLTRRAYAMFLVKIVARSAAIQKVGIRKRWQIFCELVLRGRPTTLLIAEFVGTLLVTEDLRRRLRYGVIHLRRMTERGVGGPRRSGPLIPDTTKPGESHT